MRKLILFSLCSSIIACQEQAIDPINFDVGYIPQSAEIDRSLQPDVSENAEADVVGITDVFSDYLSSRSHQVDFDKEAIDDLCVFGGTIQGEIDWNDLVTAWDIELEDDQGIKLMEVKGLFPQGDVQFISLSPDTQLENGFDQAYAEIGDEDTIEITFDKEVVRVEIDVPLDEFNKQANGEWYICKN